MHRVAPDTSDIVIMDNMMETAFEGTFGTHKFPIQDDGFMPPNAETQEWHRFLDGYDAIYNFTGHGSSNQIGDFEKMKSSIDTMVKRINEGVSRNWLAVYGGDPYKKDEPDIGAVMQYLASRHHIHVLAVQRHEYKNNMFSDMGVCDTTSQQYKHLRAALLYETTSKGWGGYEGTEAIHEYTKNPKLIGATKVIYDLLDDKISGHISFGGGMIALQEMQVAFLVKKWKCMYIPTPVKVYPTDKKKVKQLSILIETQGYGVMHLWLRDMGLLDYKGEWMQLKDMGLDENLEDYEIHEATGYWQRKIVDPFKKKKKPEKMATFAKGWDEEIPKNEFYRPFVLKKTDDGKTERKDRQVFRFAINIERIWKIDDRENTFQARFFLQLESCHVGGNPEHSVPYIEWPNLLGKLTPDFNTYWQEELNKKKETHAEQKKELDLNKFGIKCQFEGTFLMNERKHLYNFPYDFQEFCIELKSAQPSDIVFYSFIPQRQQPGTMAPSALMAVSNWDAARVSNEPPSPALFEKITKNTWSFLICQIGAPALPKIQEEDMPYWLDCEFENSDPNESASLQVYRQIRVTTLLRRKSAYITWSLLFPCLLLGTSGLLMFWIPPVDTVGERLSYGVTLGLAVIALKLNISEHVPPLSRQTFVDFYTLLTTVFVSVLCGLNIVTMRYCLPLCESEECEPDLSGFLKKFPHLGPNSEQRGHTCTCNCDVDDNLLWGSFLVWLLVQAVFFYWYQSVKGQFKRYLSRSEKGYVFR
eukprot:m.164713 g.164713  ORF g.164713 m.164713 type:complete len:756 (-) comp15243_c0_seq2:54-2321(-)